MDPAAFFGIFQFIVFLFSIIVHEVAHGAVAERLGDPTARLLGRLTLNPIRHIDPMGSIVLPFILYISGLPILGWAKPVPYDPSRLKDPKNGAGMIALAGPGTNLLIAAAFGAILRVMAASGMSPETPIAAFFGIIVYLNILLAVFNLLPVPPLDGSKVLFAFLPNTHWAFRVEDFLGRIGWPLIFVIAFFGFGLIRPIVGAVFALFAGPWGGGI